MVNVDVAEDVFVMIFSWGIPYEDEIFRDLDSAGQRTAYGKVERVPLELISRQYSKYSERDFYTAMVQDHSNRPAIVATYHGDLAQLLEIKKLIRKKHEHLVPEHPGFIRDVIHSSDSREEYDVQRAIWEAYLNEQS